MGNDRGSVTIEAALALTVLVIVAGGIITAVTTMAAHLAAVDIAGAAARSHAIGVDFEPANADVTVDVTESGGLVTVTATVPATFGSRSATAVFPVEYSASHNAAVKDGAA